jgi:hypothetical protein
MALVDDIPESLGHSGLVRAAGRGVGQLVPIIGYGASVGPNLGKHLMAGAPAEETMADFATDSLGFGASVMGGKFVGFLASTVVTLVQPEAAPATAPIANTVGNVSGGAAISVVWDLQFAPMVSNHLQNIWKKLFDAQ